MTWISGNLDIVVAYALRHAWLSALPILIGLAIAVPLGLVVTRVGRAKGAALAIIGTLYAIPSLPLLMVLPAILRTRILDPVNLETALTMYAVALLTQYCADAFDVVDPTLLEAADAMGYDRRHRFLQVELPQAGPVILAGLRVVSVSTISLVTVGSLIGVDSLGVLLIEGYRRAYMTEILIGIIGTMLIAAIFDMVLTALGAALMPWTRTTPWAGTTPRMRTTAETGERA